MNYMESVEDKIKMQVDNIFKFYDDQDLLRKIFDFSMSWYIKGLTDQREECSKEVDV